MLFFSSIVTENNSYKLLINFCNTGSDNIQSKAIFNFEIKETKQNGFLIAIIDSSLLEYII